MDPLAIIRPARDAGARGLADEVQALLAGISDLRSRIAQWSVTDGATAVAPWVAPTSWGDVATTTLEVPSWGPTRGVFLCGIFARPDWDTGFITSTEVYIRAAVASLSDTSTSPEVAATLSSIEPSAAFTWHISKPLREGDTAVSISTQAKSAGGVILGGRVSVTAVAIWTR